MTPQENKPQVPESKFMKDFAACRRAGVPIVAIETSDPAACMKSIRQKNSHVPIVRWDKAEGLTYDNDLGKVVLTATFGKTPEDEETGEKSNSWGMTDPELALRAAKRLPGKNASIDGKILKGGTILFLLNGHLFLNNMEYPQAIEVRQALWNLRDEYKKDLRMIVIPCPSIHLPEELKQDIIILDHPLPSSEELESLAKMIYTQAKVEEKDPKVFTNIAEEAKGLSLFAAEQVYAMSITEKGMDMERMWMFKKKQIEAVPGLRIWKGNETFDDVKGVQVMKDYLSMIMESDDPPTFIVFLDEIEKQMAGTKSGGNDSTMQEMHGQLLSYMADEEVLGLLEVGQPGCTKSFLAKALAGQYKRLIVILNLSEVKSKWVGESTGQLKTIFKTLSSIGKPLFIATSNKIEDLSPELRDRFSLGTFFFDLPDIEARKVLWEQYKIKYKVKSEIPLDEKDWTPRNIRDCCALAARLKCSLEKAATKIVPIVRSDPRSIEAKRRMADGKFLSAEYEGVYIYKQFTAEEAIRAIDLSGVGKA